MESRSDKPIAKSFGYRLSLRMHLELLIDILQMKVDRRGRHAQLCGGGLVVVAFSQQLQDASFVRTQIVVGAATNCAGCVFFKR